MKVWYDGPIVLILHQKQDPQARSQTPWQYAAPSGLDTDVEPSMPRMYAPSAGSLGVACKPH